ncbi:MAG TPA: heavy metal translocating P-type ATPase [Usitatibacter sp.]|jgi:Cu2+-exporting ATPase|nr:heavy metal translocating P-type ATPase [Usitatibacter sp.]
MARPSLALAAEDCFHCGLPIPDSARFVIEARGAWRRFCCAGCEAVSQAITAGGLDDYYRLRTAPAARPAEAAPDDCAIYDDALIQSRFVRTLPDGTREAELVIEGIRCAACAWLLEQSLARVPGVLSATVNATSRRALVRVAEIGVRGDLSGTGTTGSPSDKSPLTPISAVFRAVRGVGYAAWPYEQARLAQVEDGERRRLLRRVCVAGLGMMQVMMYAVPAYIGAADVSADAASLMRWAGFILTIPVLLYSAGPFFTGAWNEMRAWRPGMSTPVAIGLGAAFAASAWSTVRGSGDVYFDSITMFVFLLLGGRYLEHTARTRAARSLHHLAAWMPQSACRVHGLSDAQGEVVPAAHLNVGDLALVRPGETVPADGVVASEGADVSEALLTGESRVLERHRGAALVGGSVNAGAAFVMRVTRVGAETMLSGLRRLMERAASQRPPSVRMAERAAFAFVVFVLGAAAAGLAMWWTFDPTRALWVAVSVLIVTCPCALSLATPVALTVAIGSMARRNLIVTRGASIERLAGVTDVVFDKTGTLTQGLPALRGVIALPGQAEERCIDIAAAIGRLTSHPVDRAIVAAAGPARVTVTRHRIDPGQGAEAVIDGNRVRLGRAAFVQQLTGTPPPFEALPHAETVAWLGSRDGWMAAFRLGDTLRPEARAAIAGLHAMGMRVYMLSGDEPPPALRAARELGIAQVEARATPQRKARFVSELQESGARVAMVGDGLNDGAVLARADVAIAMGSGADLAQLEADAVLLSDNLDDLVAAMRIARAARRIVRENLAWALGYNLLVIPLALAGQVTPLAAGIGMSASSLLVVLNALRLGRMAPASLSR